MDHNARFAADSLHKEYPEPELFPKDACVVFVCSGSVSVRKGSTPTIVEKASPGLPEVLKMNAQYLGHRGPVPLYAIEVPGGMPLRTQNRSDSCQNEGSPLKKLKKRLITEF